MAASQTFRCSFLSCCLSLDMWFVSRDVDCLLSCCFFGMSFLVTCYVFYLVCKSCHFSLHNISLLMSSLFTCNLSLMLFVSYHLSLMAFVSYVICLLSFIAFVFFHLSLMSFVFLLVSFVSYIICPFVICFLSCLLSSVLSCHMSLVMTFFSCPVSFLCI